MFIVNSYTAAVFLSIITMLCWGSWANTQKMVSAKWPFQLFYRDYVIGVFLTSLIFAFSLGSIGNNGQSFFENISYAGSNALFLAFLGGVIFNLANLLLVAAIDITGLSFAFPLAIGISCSLGTTINYFVQPEGTNRLFLFLGILFFILAVVFNSMAFKKLQSGVKNLSFKGTFISILSGLFMGTFYFSVSSSISNTYESIEAGKLTPYAALAVFSSGVLLSDFIWNSNLMAKLKLWNKVDYSYYLKGKPLIHLAGIAGGMIWCIGMGLSIISAGQAGYAIAFGLGNGATLVAALWGVFVWKEFANASRSTFNRLGMMFLFFMMAIALIILSRS